MGNGGEGVPLYLKSLGIEYEKEFEQVIQGLSRYIEVHSAVSSNNK